MVNTAEYHIIALFCRVQFLRLKVQLRPHQNHRQTLDILQVSKCTDTMYLCLLLEVNKPAEDCKGVRVSRKKRKRITMKPSPRRATASQKRKTRKSVTGNLKKWEEKRKKNKTPRELPSFAINRLSISSFSLPTDGTIFPTPKKEQEETKSLKTKAIKKAGPHIPLDILATKDIIL